MNEHLVTRAKCIECGRRVGVRRHRSGRGSTLVPLYRHIAPNGYWCLSYAGLQNTVSQDLA